MLLKGWISKEIERTTRGWKRDAFVNSLTKLTNSKYFQCKSPVGVIIIKKINAYFNKKILTTYHQLKKFNFQENNIRVPTEKGMKNAIAIRIVQVASSSRN